MRARPPPLAPDVRGEFNMEKLGGVRLLSTEGRVSGGSQVSERERISRWWSEIASWIEVGLLSSGVMDEADLILRWDMSKGKGTAGGPGLISTSPARRRIRDSKNTLEFAGWFSKEEVGDSFNRRYSGM